MTALLKNASKIYLRVEEEYQIIDPGTRILDLMSKIVEEWKIFLHEQVKAEMHQLCSGTWAQNICGKCHRSTKGGSVS